MICLPKDLVSKFITGLKSGEINPDTLSSMSSAERRSFLEDFVGKDAAPDVNALFESKLLLKDQQTGLVNWAKEVGGLKPEAQRDILDKINKLDTALNPEDQKSFLSDLVAKKLGTEVTLDEANKISHMAKTASDAKAAIDRDSPTGSESRIAYGSAKVAMTNYLEDLKSDNPKTIGQSIKDAANIVRVVRMFGDISVLGHQSIKALFSEPTSFFSNAVDAFSNIGKEVGGANVLDATRADIYSRENFLNGNYQKGEGLAIVKPEEVFPEEPAEKVPGIGKIIQGNRDVYTAFEYKLRADIFDKHQDIIDATGADPKGLARYVNDITGRKNLGSLEPAASAINTFLYPPRLVASDFDVLTGGVTDLIKGAFGQEREMGNYAAKQMALSMVKVIGGMATIMAIANALKPGSAETNPQSSNFGRIKVGNTAFDYSGGSGALAVLAAKLLTGKSKSTTTGKVSILNSGKFGSETKAEVVTDFISGRATSLGQIFVDFLNGTNYAGAKFGSPQELENALAPYIASDYMEAARDPKSAPALAVLLGSMLGFFPITETPYKKK